MQAPKSTCSSIAQALFEHIERRVAQLLFLDQLLVERYPLQEAARAYRDLEARKPAARRCWCREEGQGAKAHSKWGFESEESNLPGPGKDPRKVSMLFTHRKLQSLQRSPRGWSQQHRRLQRPALAREQQLR